MSEINRNKSRIVEVDALKGIAIIGVVLVHMSFKGRFDPETLMLVQLLKEVFGWCVIAFFFASGVSSKHIIDSSQLKNLLIKKTQRLIIPCIIFSITYKLAKAIISTFGYSPGLQFPSNYLDIFIYLIEPIGPQFYFLPYLFGVTALVALLELFTGKNSVLIFSSVFLVLIQFLFPAPLYGFGSNLELIPIYLFSYVAGKTMATSNGYPALVCWVAFSVTLSIIVSTSFVVLNIPITILIYLILKNISLISSYIMKLKLGEMSSAIYVWHAPIVLPTTSIVAVKIFGGGLFVIIPILFSTIVICYFLNIITSRYNLFRYWRF